MTAKKTFTIEDSWNPMRQDSRTTTKSFGKDESGSKAYARQVKAALIGLAEHHERAAQMHARFADEHFANGNASQAAAHSTAEALHEKAANMARAEANGSMKSSHYASEAARSASKQTDSPNDVWDESAHPRDEDGKFT